VPKEILQEKFKLNITRFDLDLFQLANDTVANYKPLAQKYPDFFYLFTHNIVNIGDSANPQLGNILHDFLNDKNISLMQNAVQSKFTNVDSYNVALTDAFKGYHYLFKNKTIPEITYFTSGYNYATVATAHTLGIGLEMYLGSNYEPYSLLQIPLYKRNIMKSEYMVSDALNYWIFTEFENNKNETNLLNLMLFRGKIMYALEKIMPNTPDSIKIGYTKVQLDWCEKHEKEIFTYFIQKNLLFSPVKVESMKYVNEGPFTAGFPRESPGKVGVWLGWQIVKNYMQQNSIVTLPELFNNTNGQAILKSSKYKPK
jgi:hypothetical protein